jgi:hypothetical protein
MRTPSPGAAAAPEVEVESDAAYVAANSAAREGSSPAEPGSSLGQSDVIVGSVPPPQAE